MVSLLQIYMALNSYRQVLLQSCPQISVLMVEQTDACKRHHHVIFIAACNNICITHGSTGLCDVFYTTLMSSFDIIGEGEECIASQSHILHFVKTSMALSRLALPKLSTNCRPSTWGD